MPFSYILFDLDGTLTDSQQGIIRCVQYALDSFGIRETDMQKLRRFIGPPLIDGFMEIIGMDQKTARKAGIKDRERYAAAGMFENKVYPGIPALLEHLKNQNKILCVATSKPQTYTEKILEKFELEPYFSLVAGTKLGNDMQTKSDIIQKILKHFKIKNLQNVIMVGDRKYDITGAKNCGIASVGVRYGFAEKNELESCAPDYICDTVEDLYSIL